MHHLAGALGQCDKTVGADVMGDTEAVTGGHIHIVTVEFMRWRVTNGMDDDVDVVPVFVELGEHSVNLLVTGHIAGERQLTAPLIREFLNSGLKLFVLVSEGQFSAFTGECLGDAVGDGMFAGYTNNQCFLATEDSHGYLLPVFLGFSALSPTCVGGRNGQLVVG